MVFVKTFAKFLDTSNKGGMEERVIIYLYLFLLNWIFLVHLSLNGYFILICIFMAAVPYGL